MSHRRHAILWILLSLFAMVAITSWAPVGWLQNSVAEQVSMTRSWLGDEAANRAVKVANAVTQPLIVAAKGIESGAPQSNDGMNKMFGHVVNGGFAMFAWRGSVMIYGVVFRLFLLLCWLLPGGLILLGAIVDGYARRILKLSTFAYSSPAIMQGAIHLMIAMVGMPLIYVVLPAPLPPILPFALILAFAFGARQAVSEAPRMA